MNKETLKDEIYRTIRKTKGKKYTYGDLRTPLAEKDLDFEIAQAITTLIERRSCNE